MARTFTAASSEKVSLSLGAGGSLSGAFTMAGIVKPATDGFVGAILAVGANSGPYWVIYRDGSNFLSAYNGAVGGAASTTTFTAAQGWAFVAVTKTAGNTAARFHIYKYGSNTWTHEDSGTAQNNATPGTSSCIAANTDGTAPWNGDIAACGAWVGAFTDARVESMPFSLPAWFQVQPNGLWLLDQSATTMLVNDLTGNGANQSGLTGTTVATSAVPIFSYGANILQSKAVVTVVPPTPAATTGRLHLGRRRAVYPRSTAIRVPVGVDS